jgi:hypothetical protein
MPEILFALCTLGFCAGIVAIVYSLGSHEGYTTGFREGFNLRANYAAESRANAAGNDASDPIYAGR